MSELNEIFRARIWNALKEGTLTIEQLAATDDKTAALCPGGLVLIKAATWAREELRKRNDLEIKAQQNAEARAKRRAKKAA